MIVDQNNFPTLIKIDEILSLIPHRYPFLLIDQVHMGPNFEAIGIKNVTINESFFQGHFPEVPIMPGVTIIEALAQTAAVMVGVSLDLADKNLLIYFLFFELCLLCSIFSRVRSIYFNTWSVLS